MKNTQIVKTTVASLIVLAGVFGTGSALAQEMAKKPQSFTVLAAFPQEGNHVIKLVEYFPGMTGVVETGVPVFGLPITPGLKKMSVIELYHHFAGASVKVPQTVLAANARAEAAAKVSKGKLSSPPPPNAHHASKGGGGTLYTYDEIYYWFIPTACEQWGASQCLYDYDWESYITPPVTYSSACFFVGSEGTNAASMAGMYWDPAYGAFLPVIDDAIDPGWCYCYSMSSSGAAYYLEWDLWGAGYNTTVGLAVYY